MTHVQVDTNFTEAVDHKDLNGDGIGYVESYDFSKANMSQESRIAAITTIASVCYQNPKALGSVSLYDRLATENKGLPSSSYEFVPVLLQLHGNDNGTVGSAVKALRASTNCIVYGDMQCFKYGEHIVEDGRPYLLTNLRALIADVGDGADQFFNTEEECAIIAKHFKVYKSKIDLSTARQFMRHRASWQELSRRYVSGKKAEFEFYISPKMASSSSVNVLDDESNEIQYTDLIAQCVSAYDEAIARGVKPEEARRILPQAMYTTVWSAWQPKQLEVFYKLRCDKHAQAEIQELAYAMKDLKDQNE